MSSSRLLKAVITYRKPLATDVIPVVATTVDPRPFVTYRNPRAVYAVVPNARRLVGYTRLYADINYRKLTVQDLYLKNALRVKPDDVIAFLESLTFNFNKALADDVPLSDQAYLTLNKSITGDSVGFTEATVFSFGKALTDSIGFSESLVMNMNKPLADSFGITDVVYKTVNKPFADSFSVGNDVLHKTFTKAASDSVSFTEAQTFSVNKAISESFVLSEGIYKTINKPISGDTVAFSEGLLMVLQQVGSGALNGSSINTKAVNGEIAEVYVI